MALTWLQRSRITEEHRQEWYTALAKVAEDGDPLYDALVRMSGAFEKTRHPLTPLIKLVTLRIRGGGGGTTAARRTFGTELKGMVPADEAMLIQAGHMSGQVSMALTNAASLVETKKRLEKAIVYALIEPTIYFFAFLGVLLFMGASVFPSFEKSRPRAEWPLMAQLIADLADHAVAVGITAPLLVAGFIAAIKWLAPNWSGRTREWFDRHVPPFRLIAALYGSSFLTTLSGYIGAGVPLMNAVKSISATANPFIQYQCDRITDGLRNGTAAEDVLCSLSVLPQRYHWIVAVYGMSAASARAYQRISSKMVDAVLGVMQKTAFLAGKLMLLVVGLLIYFLWSSLYGVVAAPGHMF